MKHSLLSHARFLFLQVFFRLSDRCARALQAVGNSKDRRWEGEAYVRIEGLETEEFFIDTGAGRVFARTWNFDGTGDAGEAPVILFHDSLGCVELWRDFPSKLARATGRGVVAYDRLGFGRSDKHPGSLTPSFVRDEARGAFSTLRSHLGITNFVAFGHSVGGGMAISAAGAFAKDCRALVTESAQAFVEDRTLTGIREAERGFARPDQMERLRRYHGDKAEWVLRSWVETWLSADFASWTLDKELPEVRCPALVLHGDNDEYGSVRHAERIGTLAAGPATIKILTNCGHVPHREDEATVLDAIGDFLG